MTMRMTRKVEPGRCDVCGCAVVKPSSYDDVGWKYGHYYSDFSGRLLAVRCEQHGGQGFEPMPTTDETVCGEFAQDSDVPRKRWRP